jgi:glycosyltransferase involved in cell wall biosynthesis
MTILPLALWRIGFWGSARLLVAPRGEFGSAALRRRSVKKRIYIAAFRLLGIHRATIWHSTAPHETADIQQLWGSGAKIIERENDTLLADRARVPELRTGPLRAAFLGRMVEHKGLSIALTALSAVRAPVQFDVYGSREDDSYASLCEALADALPENVTVTFHGVVSPESVVDVLAAHDVLIMPTAGENFGHVIAEALSASCFVVTTAHTPWTDWLSRGGGTVLDRSVHAWADAIESLANADPHQRLVHREAAGETYEAWLSQPRPPHIWTLALDEMALRRN